MEMDWKNLPFGYVKTDYNVRCYFRNGKWGEKKFFIPSRRIHNPARLNIY